MRKPMKYWVSGDGKLILDQFDKKEISLHEAAILADITDMQMQNMIYKSHVQTHRTRSKKHIDGLNTPALQQFIFAAAEYAGSLVPANIKEWESKEKSYLVQIERLNKQIMVLQETLSSMREELKGRSVEVARIEQAIHDKVLKIAGIHHGE